MKMKNSFDKEIEKMVFSLSLSLHKYIDAFNKEMSFVDKLKYYLNSTFSINLSSQKSPKHILSEIYDILEREKQIAEKQDEFLKEQLKRGNAKINKLDNQFPHKKLIKILFITSNPNDKPRIKSEFDNIKSTIGNSIVRNELNLLSPVCDVNYISLLIQLRDHEPTVLHYSGHGDTNGLCFSNPNTGETQIILNEDMKDIFEKRFHYLRLVFLNSCFSSHQAQLISAYNIYVLGIDDQEIHNQTAQHFAECFYVGFATQEPPMSIEKAIKIGCTSFVKTYPDKENIISLWKNGNKIDYRSL